jgi:hypothetical protein
MASIDPKGRSGARPDRLRLDDKPPLKLSGVPSFSMLIWWHTEQD